MLYFDENHVYKIIPHKNKTHKFSYQLKKYTNLIHRYGKQSTKINFITLYNVIITILL